MLFEFIWTQYGCQMTSVCVIFRKIGFFQGLVLLEFYSLTFKGVFKKACFNLKPSCSLFISYKIQSLFAVDLSKYLFLYLCLSFFSPWNHVCGKREFFTIDEQMKRSIHFFNWRWNSNQLDLLGLSWLFPWCLLPFLQSCFDCGGHATKFKCWWAFWDLVNIMFRPDYVLNP